MGNKMSDHDFYQVALKVLLRNKKGEFLFLKCRDSSSHAGYYDLPGGRIDVDEFHTPFEDILAREIREEVGDIKYTLDRRPATIGRKIIPAAYTHSKERDFHILYVVFLVQYQNGEIKISAEHKDFMWLDLKSADTSKYFKEGVLECVNRYLEIGGK